MSVLNMALPSIMLDCTAHDSGSFCFAVCFVGNMGLSGYRNACLLVAHAGLAFRGAAQSYAIQALHSSQVLWMLWFLPGSFEFLPGSPRSLLHCKM